jgi:hypothetical protein
MRQLDFAVRPSDWLGRDFPQDGVRESGRGALPRPLDQLHAFMDRGVGRHALEIAKLIHAHPQRDSDFGVKARRWARGVALDQVVELRLESQDSEDDLRRQAGVARIEVGRSGEKEVGGVSALVYALQNVKGY